MKKFHFGRIIALLLMLAMLPVQAWAASEDYEITYVSVSPAKSQATIRMRVPEKFSASDFQKEGKVSIGGTDVKIKAESVKSVEGVGYILVIDRSGYYTAYLEYDYVKDVAMQIIKSMDENDRVAVVFVDSAVDCNDAFMIKSAATSLVNGSESAQRQNNNMPTEAVLYEGIKKAQALATQKVDNVPSQRAIIVLSDFGADDSAKTREAVLKKVSRSVPMITVPFWCNGYTPSTKTREVAMEAVKTGRSELMGYTFHNVEVTIDVGKDFDSSQGSSVAKAVDELMNFVYFYVDITPLYKAKSEAAEQELRINYDGQETARKVTIDRAAIATPKKAKATPSPTPDQNPVIMKFGDENADVLLLQQILKELYYYDGEMNRKFDTGVQIALMEFCADNGLEFSDELRQDVWQFLQSDKAAPKATPVPTPEPEAEPTRDPSLFLMMGDKDAKVYNLQTKLKDLGYLAEEDVSMIFDEATQLALYAFCEENGLELRDGLTMAMWNLLQSGNAVAKPTATPEPTPVITPEPTRDPNQKFANGDQNGGVRSLQNYLISHYYLDAQYRTGIFDANTQWAVDDFCQVNGLEVIDDGMSLEAWEVLQSGTAIAKATVVPETPVPTATRDPQMKFLLEDSNDQVIMLQRRLAQMYYLDEADISGVFDQKTLIAVVTFCDINGLTGGVEAVNGMSNTAWNLLMAGSPIAKPTATPEPTAVPTEAPTPEPTQAPEFLAVTMGDSNAYVLRYQQRLVELGYLTEEFTAGTYDQATQTAQDTLCEYNNLAPQTGADVDLQQFAFSSTIRNKATMGFFDKLQFVMTQEIAIGTLNIPVWILACVGLVIFLVLIVVVLLMPGKKRAAGKASAAAAAPAQSAAAAMTAEDAPTGDLEIDVNADVPTSENVNNWQIVLTVTYMGHSVDNKYTLIDGVPIRIGRRSGNEVLINAEDTSASRDHGQLVYRGNKLYYRDSSKKGSIVDGEPLLGAEREVRSGSVIEISRHSIRIVT